MNVVQDGEVPYKVVTAEKKTRRENSVRKKSTALFGHWQTEPFKPQKPVNVSLFSMSWLLIVL